METVRFRVLASVTSVEPAVCYTSCAFRFVFVEIERHALEVTILLLGQLKCKSLLVGRFPQHSWRGGARGFPLTGVYPQNGTWTKMNQTELL